MVTVVVLSLGYHQIDVGNNVTLDITSLGRAAG